MIKKHISASILMIIASILLFQIFFAPASYAKEDTDSITIMFTHDMHSNLLPFLSEEEGVISEIGGYARLISLINNERQKNPEIGRAHV